MGVLGVEAMGGRFCEVVVVIVGGVWRGWETEVGVSGDWMRGEPIDSDGTL